MMKNDPPDAEIVVRFEDEAIALVRQYNLSRRRADLNSLVEVIDSDDNCFWATAGDWIYIVDRRTEHVSQNEGGSLP